MSSVEGAALMLVAARRRASLRTSAALAEWSDAKAARFEAEVVTPAIAEAKRFEAVLDDVTRTIEAARRRVS